MFFVKLISLTSLNLELDISLKTEMEILIHLGKMEINDFHGKLFYLRTF